MNNSQFFIISWQKFQFPLLVYHPLLLDFSHFHPLTDHISSFATLHNFICAFIVCSVSIHRSLIGISTASITFYHHHIGFYSVFLFQITKWELDVTFRYKLSSFYIEIILFKWQLRLAFNLAMRAIKKGFEAIKEKKLINWESFISHFTNKNEKKKFRKKISKKLKSSPFEFHHLQQLTSN